MTDFTNDLYLVKCHFCGKVNEFTTNEISTGYPNNPTFKEKYCLECGAPLLFKCPRCNTVFRLDHNFQTYFKKEVLNSYWEPRTKKIDTLIPDLQILVNNYKEFVEELTLNEFRANQKQFLNKLDTLAERTEKIQNFLRNTPKNFFSPEAHKLDSKISKTLQEITEDISEIQQHIDPQNHLVDLKKEKQIKKKGFSFADVIPKLEKLLLRNRNTRKEEIREELAQLKPGLEKYKNHFKVDPQFFEMICPTCQVHLYSIQESIYLLNTSKKLEFLTSMPLTISENSKEQQLGGAMIKFDVTVNILTQKAKQFNGQFAITLLHGEPFTFGRNFIREVEYTGEGTENILFNEVDPLARVSNSQITLLKTNEGIVVKPMAYDERRVGLYYNSLAHDLRIKNPEGILLKSDDLIIIPLISKDNIHNQIKLKFIGNEQ